MIVRHGRSLTDPKLAEEGFLMPIGGHKGYVLALIFGLLAGSLQGAAMGRDVIDFNKDAVTTTNTGQAILVIDLRAFGDPAEFKARVDTIVRDIRNSERLDGVTRIWLPGEQSHARRERYRVEGIPVSTGVINEIAVMAREIGIQPLV